MLSFSERLTAFSSLHIAKEFHSKVVNFLSHSVEKVITWDWSLETLLRESKKVYTSLPTYEQKYLFMVSFFEMCVSKEITLHVASIVPSASKIFVDGVLLLATRTKDSGSKTHLRKLYEDYTSLIEEILVMYGPDLESVD